MLKLMETLFFKLLCMTPVYIQYTLFSIMFNFIFPATLHASWILLTYNIARHGNQKLGLFKKGMKPLIRLMWYAGLAPTMIVSYLLAKDLISRQIEKKSVSATALMGPIYARGGLEYYNQMLLRNKCIGKFEEPHRRFNLEGELLQGVIRTRRVPLLQLRDLCGSAL